MKTTEQQPVASIASLTGNSFDGYGAPDLAVITPPTSLRSESTIQADPPIDEHASERTFTAEECSSLSMRHLRRLCDEAFTELDVDFPEWGVRNRYDMLCAEVTARADAMRNHPSSRGAGGAREVFRDNVGSARFEMILNGNNVGFVRYDMHGGLVRFLETYVQRDYRGRSTEVIPVLLRQAMLDAHHRRLAVIPVCPHAVQFMDQYPEYRTLMPTADEKGRPLAGLIKSALTNELHQVSVNPRPKLSSPASPVRDSAILS